MTESKDTEPLLEVENFEVEFRESHGLSQPRVRGLSFALREGETMALVGQRGSGKSICLRAMLGLLPPGRGRVTGGAVRYRGRDLLTLGNGSLREIRRTSIGFLFPEVEEALDPLYTMRDHVTEMLRSARKPVDPDAIAHQLYEVGIAEPEECLRRYPWQLGTGTRQRLMIAMALLCGTELLVADEPTAELDSPEEGQFIELLMDLREKRGITLLLATYNLGIVEELADRVAVLYRGVIIESGSAEEVLMKPKNAYTQALINCRPKLGERRPRLHRIDKAAHEAAIEAARIHVPDFE